MTSAVKAGPCGADGACSCCKAVESFLRSRASELQLPLGHCPHTVGAHVLARWGERAGLDTQVIGDVIRMIKRPVRWRLSDETWRRAADEAATLAETRKRRCAHTRAFCQSVGTNRVSISGVMNWKRSSRRRNGDAPMPKRKSPRLRTSGTARCGAREAWVRSGFRPSFCFDASSSAPPRCWRPPLQPANRGSSKPAERRPRPRAS